MQNDRTAPVSARPRRVKTSKPGIYYREDRTGQRRYEFSYRDATGKQRWPGGFATLKDADGARSDILRRIRRGERVAPVKTTLVEYAERWLDGEAQLSRSTRARYEWAIRRHLAPRLGRLKIGEVTEDHVAGIVADMLSAGYRPATVRAVLAPLSLVLSRAVRRGAVTHNAVRGLEARERPRGDARHMRILSKGELTALLDATTPVHRCLIATLAFAGLRVSEAIGLRWSDVDLARGQLHVRGQVDHTSRERIKTKTVSSTRSVVLMPALGRMLAAHRLASRFSSDTDPVFATVVGTTMNRDNVRTRILAPAADRARLKVDGQPTLRTHDLRHCFASLLIAGGASVVFVAAQLGHSKPDVTLNTYAHLFDERDHAAQMATILEDGYAATLAALTPAPTLAPAAAQQG